MVVTSFVHSNSGSPVDALHWTDLLLAHPALTSEYILEIADGVWECRCGNTEELEGFIACDENGLEVAEELGPWDGVLRACQRCWRVINGDTLEVLGLVSESVIDQNEEYRWGDSVE